jgi:hypothetical protein
MHWGVNHEMLSIAYLFKLLTLTGFLMKRNLSSSILIKNTTNLKTHTSENIWQVQTKTQRKGKTPSKIRGYLIIELKAFLIH